VTDLTTISTLEIFLAHAYALEHESVERYSELADVMAVHNNNEVAAFFTQMAAFGLKHAAEVSDLAKDYTLPSIPPWEYQWTDGVSPEAGDYDGAHYLMSTRHALEFALLNETRGRDFYAEVTEHSPNEQVKELAAEFRDEEAEHVQMLEKWIARTPQTTNDWHEDWDPANSPE
jgi:rubrerythrin